MRTVTAAVAGRVDAILAAACPDISRSLIQRLITAGDVRKNGEPVRKAEQVQPGDVLTLQMPGALPAAAVPDFDLPVLFEDEYMAAIDKPAGLAVHGAEGDTNPAVAAWWLARLAGTATGFMTERPGIVHRLDKDTTGVLLLAKTPRAQAALSAAFEARETAKTYLAVCDGIPNRPRAVIDSPIGRHPGDRMRMALVRNGRDARTEYEVLYDDGERSFVQAKPETGRTHQIRVHLAAVGIPVRYDRVYGKTTGGRQQLHAWRIQVPHPAGGTLTVTAPLPGDMRDEIQTIGGSEVAAPFAGHTPPTLEQAP